MGDVPEAGDLVCAWAAGEELTGVPLPEGFFDGEEALSLDESAFDLAVVDGRVDGASDVHLEVGADCGVVAGETVDFDFGEGDTLGEVEEHFTLVLAPDVANFGSLVEAVRGEVDTVKVGGCGELVHAGVRAKLLAVGLETFVELLAGVPDGISVQVGGCGGGGGRGIGYSVGGGFGDVDVFKWDLECFGCNHGHLCVKTLTHLSSSVSYQDRTIVVNVYQSTSLVEEQGGEGDTKLGWNESKASLLPLVGCVELVDCLPPGFVVRLLFDLVVHEWNVPVLELLIEMGGLSRLVHVDLSNLVSWHTELVCNLFDITFGNEETLGTSETSECSIGNSVGLADTSTDVDVWNLVATINVR